MSYVPELDRWISAEFARLAEIIKDYDPDLELRWIPPEFRSFPEDRKNPYCIWDTKRNCHVMFASELDNPKDILANLFNIDNKNGSVLERVEAQNRAARTFQLKEYMDQFESQQEFVAFTIGNEKSRWKHEGIWFDEELRRLDGR